MNIQNTTKPNRLSMILQGGPKKIPSLPLTHEQEKELDALYKRGSAPRIGQIATQFLEQLKREGITEPKYGSDGLMDITGETYENPSI